MRVLFFAIFMPIIVFAEIVKAAPNCETAASRPVRAAMAALKLSLRDHSLSLDDLQQSLARDGGLTPYSNHTRSAENLSYRQAFERAVASFNDSSRAELRREIDFLIRESSIVAEHVSAARSQSAPVLSPELGSPLEKKGLETREARAFAEGTLEGRPVFITHFYSNRVSRAILYDPMNKVKSKRIKHLIDFDSTQLTSPPILLEKDGRSLAIYMSHELVIDLGTAETKTLSSLKLNKVIFSKGSIAAAIVVNTPTGKQLLVSMSDSAKEFRRSLVLYDFKKPRSLPKIILNVNCGGMRLHEVNSRQFVTCLENHQTTLVYDVRENRVLKKVIRSLSNDNNSTIFEDQGRIKMATYESPFRANQLIQLTDLETGSAERFEEFHDISGKLTTVYHDGVPHIYFIAHDGLYAANTRERSERRVGGPGGEFPSVHKFEWAGRLLLSWSFPTGHYQVIDLTTGAINHALFDKAFTRTAPFVYEGRAYAFALTKDSAPYLINLTPDRDFGQH